MGKIKTLKKGTGEMKNVRMGILVLLALTVLISGCDKKKEAPTYNEGFSPKPIDFRQRQEEERAAKHAAWNAVPQNLPKADLSVPFSNYVKLADGNHLMFMCYALSGMPTNYEKIAEIWSQEYKNTRDKFKEQDIMKKLTPQIDGEIEKNKNNRYFVHTTDGRTSLGHYDFTAKGFPVNQGIWASDGNTRFMEGAVGEYSLSFTNGDPAFKFIKVEDADVARKIEEMVTNFKEFHLQIYAFAQGADSGKRKRVWAEIVKMQLTDSKGNDLLKR